MIKAGWDSLFTRRKRLKLTQFFKYYHGIHDFSNSRFIHVDSEISRRTRHNLSYEPHHLMIPSENFVSYKQSFLFSGTTLWNSVSADTAFYSSLTKFDTAISQMSFK